MRLKKILLFGLLAAIVGIAHAETQEEIDRKTATSLQYVTTELSDRQDKIATQTGTKAIVYGDTAGEIEPRAVTTTLTGATNELPTVGAVKTGLATKQKEIPARDDNAAVTYTGTAGTIGAKGIYDDTGSYIEQSDNLIDAETFNKALKNALDTEFICARRPDAYGPDGECWLWEIHVKDPTNLYNRTTNPVEQGTIASANGQNSSLNTRIRTGFINIEPSTQYTISASGLTYIYVFQYKSDGTYLGIGTVSDWRPNPYTFTTNSQTGKIRIVLANGTNSNTAPAVTPSDLEWLRVEQTNLPYTTLVPSGYTPLEYIQSTGTQCIDTGIQDTSKVEISKINFTGTYNAEYNLIYGSHNNQTQARRTILLFTENKKLQVATGYHRSNAETSTALAANTDYAITAIFGNTSKVILDGIEKVAPTVGDNAATGLNDYLFCYNYNGEKGLVSKVQIGNVKIWGSTDTLVRNFIPARRDSDNKIGMYDKVSNTFFSSIGTAAFSAGPEINNIIYIPQNQ